MKKVNSKKKDHPQIVSALKNSDIESLKENVNMLR